MYTYAKISKSMPGLFVTVNLSVFSSFSGFSTPTDKKTTCKQLPNTVLKKDFGSSTFKRKTGMNNYTVCGL